MIDYFLADDDQPQNNHPYSQPEASSEPWVGPNL